MLSRGKIIFANLIPDDIRYILASEVKGVRLCYDHNRDNLKVIDGVEIDVNVWPQLSLCFSKLLSRHLCRFQVRF